MPITPADIKAKQANGDIPLVALTCYSKTMAELMDDHVDIMLVGDSLGMVLYGLDSTVEVTMEMMIRHTEAVARGAKNALIIGDMPHGSYESSPNTALKNATALLQAGADAIKLEGGLIMADTIAHLTKNNIPVMAHIGLLPQSVHQMGGYKIQGKTPEQKELLLQDAITVQEAGAFAVVLEGTKQDIAELITEKLDIPTIGIGASPKCDGQILVTDDMLGLTKNPPKFVKRYGDAHENAADAIKRYASEVRSNTFPTQEHCY